jgi:hypothetical protein
MNTNTTREPLSDLQAKVLAYLVKCVQLEDLIPPLHVIAKYFGWASANSAALKLEALKRKGYLTRTHYNALMLADRPFGAPQLTSDQRMYLAAAWEQLEEHAEHQRSVGNDSIAAGAMASAHVIKELLAPVFIGVDLASGPDRTAYWTPRKEAAHD